MPVSNMEDKQTCVVTHLYISVGRYYIEIEEAGVGMLVMVAGIDKSIVKGATVVNEWREDDEEEEEEMEVEEEDGENNNDDNEEDSEVEELDGNDGEKKKNNKKKKKQKPSPHAPPFSSKMTSRDKKNASIISSFIPHVFLPLPVYFSTHFYSSPALRISIEPLHPINYPKVVEGLRSISKTYLSITTHVEENGENVLYGDGELQMDVCMYELRCVYTNNTEIKVSDPTIPLCESVDNTSMSPCEVMTSNGTISFSVIAEKLEEGLDKEMENGRVRMMGPKEQLQEQGRLKRLQQQRQKEREEKERERERNASNASTNRAKLYVPPKPSTSLALSSSSSSSSSLLPDNSALAALHPSLSQGSLQLLQSKYDYDMLLASSIWVAGDEDICSSGSAGKANTMSGNRNNTNLLVNDTLPFYFTFYDQEFEGGSKLGISFEDYQRTLVRLAPSIIQGFRWACREGPLCGEPLKNIKFRLIKAQLNDSLFLPTITGSGRNAVTSYRLKDNPFMLSTQIIPCIKRCCSGALLLATPRLMEPIYYFSVITAPSSTEYIYKIMMSRRGNVVGEGKIVGTPLVEIHGFVPVLESFGLEVDIRAYTQGQSYIQMMFDHYDIVDGDPLDKTIQLIPLVPVERNGLSRELLVKTRRRKGLSEGVALTKFFDEKMLQRLKEQEIDIENI